MAQHMQLCFRQARPYIRRREDRLLAITIRNKTTEAMIREIGRRRGEGPSAVVRRLAERELRERRGEVAREERERRKRAWEELDKLVPPEAKRIPWKEIEAEMQAMYDYLDDERE